MRRAESRRPRRRRIALLAASATLTAAALAGLPGVALADAGAAPGAPTSVQATAGDGMATVSWTAGDPGGSAVTGYVATSSPGGFSCQSVTTSCPVTGLTDGQPYTFTVHGTNSAGDGPESAASAPVTPAAPSAPFGTPVPDPPFAPTGVVATPGDGAVTISWDASSDSTITGYFVTGSPAGHCSSLGQSCTASGLTDGTPYTFSVVARNNGGDSPPGTAGPVTPQAPAAAPGAPGNVSESSTGTPGEIAVNWTAAAANGSPIDGYTASDGNGDSCSTGGAGTGCTVGNLGPGSYQFSVSAHNALGSGPAASGNAASPLTVGQPRNLRIVPGNGNLTVTWSSAIIPATGYHVSWPGGSADTAGTSYVIGHLTNGTSYLVSVQATYGPLSGAPVTASGTPFGSPGPPTGLAAAAHNGAATLTWTAPLDDGGAPPLHYVVTSAGTIDCTTGTTSCTVTGLTNGTTYSFLLQAVNGGGATSASVAFPSVTPQSDATPAPTTTTVTAPFVRHTQLVLSKPTVKRGVTSVSVQLKADGSTPVASQRLSVVATDSLRHKTTHLLTTNGSGKATVSIKATVSTSLQVVFVGSPGFTASSKSTKLVVAAPQSCSLSHTVIGGTLTASGTCREPHLPKHTGLRLQYLRGKTWVTAAKGTSTGDTLRFRFSLRGFGTFRFRILLNSNAIYGATTLALPSVRVS